MLPEQNNNISDVIEEDSPGIGKSFSFDFKLGEFITADGKIEKKDGYEALKTWITKVLLTRRNTYEIYNGSNYGIRDLRELITSHFPYAYIKSEIEKEVTENLLKNSCIKNVQNFKFERNKRNLNVSFDCITIYGVITSEVVL